MTSRDLHDLLRDLVDEETAASAGSAVDVDRELRVVGARVARQRLVRGAAASAGAAAAVVVLAVAVQAAGPEPAPPATPTPSPSETLAPSPTPTPTATPSATPTPTEQPEPEVGGVTVHPSLPPAQGLPEGLLATTTREWSLMTYEADGDVATPTSPTVVYLLAPDGTVYEVPTPLDLGSGEQDGRFVTEWLAGSSLVLLHHGTAGGETWTEVADVLTGEILMSLPGGQVPASAHFVGDGTSDVVVAVQDFTSGGQDDLSVVTSMTRLTADGRVVASAPGFTPLPLVIDAVVVDGTGSRLLLADAAGVRVVDARTLATTGGVGMPAYGSGGCRGATWVGDEVLLACSDDSPDATPSTDVWATGPSGLRQLAAKVPGSPYGAVPTERGMLVVDRGSAQVTEVRVDGTLGTGLLIDNIGQGVPTPGGALLARLPHEGLAPGVMRYAAAANTMREALRGVYPSQVHLARSR